MDDEDVWLIALAQHVGSHALAWFVGALLLLMLGTALGWWLLQRTAPRLRPLAHWPPAVLLALCLAVGLVVIGTAAMVFVELAEAMDTEETLGRIDEALTESLRRSVAPAVLQGFAAITRLGDVATLVGLGVVVGLLLLAARRFVLALGWGTALGGNGLLNPALKSLFERVRPLHEHGLVHEAGFSFPSGHTSGSVVAYGMLAYVLMRLLPPRWHLPVLLTAVALAFGIGCSRVFLQVHWFSDVLAGFVSGSAWLLVCVLSSELLRWQVRGRPAVSAPRT